MSHLLLVRKLNLGPDDPSKPLLTLIIERLTSGAFGASSNNQAQAQKPSVEEPKASKITKEKESIESSLNDIKKTQERSKDSLLQAKETPTLAQASVPAPQKEAVNTKLTGEPKHDSGKFVGAKKEVDPLPTQPLPKDDKKKSDDNIPGKKFQTVPDDAMKKKVEAAPKQDLQNDLDGKSWVD